MRSLVFFWLTLSLANVDPLSLENFDQFETLALQADDAITTTPLTDSHTPTELVVDNPTHGLEIEAKDGGQIPENSIARNQQQEGRSKADTSKCLRSLPRSSGAKRRREELNYCRNDFITSPSLLQQQEKVRPTGNLGNEGNEGKPGMKILVSPYEARPEWAPPLSDFFIKDPCQKRPYRVCAPYVPGRDFEEWSSNVITLSLDLTACQMCMYWPRLPSRRLRARQNMMDILY